MDASSRPAGSDSLEYTGGFRRSQSPPRGGDLGAKTRGQHDAPLSSADSGGRRARVRGETRNSPGRRRLARLSQLERDGGIAVSARVWKFSVGAGAGLRSPVESHGRVQSGRRRAYQLAFGGAGREGSESRRHGPVRRHRSHSGVRAAAFTCSFAVGDPPSGVLEIGTAGAIHAAAEPDFLGRTGGVLRRFPLAFGRDSAAPQQRRRGVRALPRPDPWNLPRLLRIRWLGAVRYTGWPLALVQPGRRAGDIRREPVTGKTVNSSGEPRPRPGNDIQQLLVHQLPGEQPRYDGVPVRPALEGTGRIDERRGDGRRRDDRTGNRNQSRRKGRA